MSNENTTPPDQPSDEVTEVSAEEVVIEETATDAADDIADDAATADAAWRDVLEQLDSFAQAAGRWARAAVDDPENRRRATELKEHIEETARELGDSIDGAVDSASKTDVGSSFKEAAGKTGEAFASAGRRVSEETAPRMASAFRGAAEALRSAAEKMEQRPSPPPPQPDDADVADAQAGSEAPADTAAE